MNELILSRFTPQLLRGAEQLGVDGKALSSALRISQRQISRMACGLANLSVRHAKVLERKTRRSIGELAVLGIAADARPAQRARHASLIRGTLKLQSDLAAID